MAAGEATGSVGDEPTAAQYSCVISAAEERVAGRPGDLAAQREFSIALSNDGHLLQDRDPAGALTQYQRSLAICELLAAEQPCDPSAQRDLSVALNKVGRMLEDRDPAGALVHYERSLTIREALVQSRPDDLSALRDLSIALNNVGRILEEGDPVRALDCYWSSLDVIENLVAVSPGDRAAQRDLSFALGCMGRVLRERDPADSLTYFQRALTVRQGLAAAQPGSLIAQFEVSMALSDVGRALEARDLVDALAHHARAFAIIRALAMAEPANLTLQRGRDDALGNVRRVRSNMVLGAPFGAAAGGGAAPAPLLGATTVLRPRRAEVGFGGSPPMIPPDPDWAPAPASSSPSASRPRPAPAQGFAPSAVEKGSPAERLEFTVAYPGLMTACERGELLFYAHLPSMREQLETRLALVRGQLGEHPGRASGLSRSVIEPGRILRIRPVFSTLRSVPQWHEFAWQQRLEEVRFSLEYVGHQPDSDDCRGFVEISVDGLLIGQVVLSIRVESSASETRTVPRAPVSMMRRIFASYAHEDAEVVQRHAAAYRGVGIELFVDHDALASGQDWAESIRHAISDHDLFQLFWSRASASSSEVAKEWRFALDVVAPGKPAGTDFVRPLYWQQPMPPVPIELARLHFTYVEPTQLGVRAKTSRGLFGRFASSRRSRGSR